MNFSGSAVGRVLLVSFYFVLVTGLCDVYMAPSPLGGRGVFAGRTYRPGELIEEDVCVLILETDSHKWSTWNYQFKTPWFNIGVLMLGYGMIYNHGSNQNKNVRYVAEGAEPKESSVLVVANYKHHTTHTNINFNAVKPVEAGEEFVSHYGDESWFEGRNMSVNEQPRGHAPYIPLTELQAYGYCLSQVAVRVSSIPLAGRGLFAKKPFRVGDILSVSPLLLLPRHEVELTNEYSVLINYLVSAEGSDVALLPFTQIALVNHGGVKANARLEWLDWPAVRSFNGTVLSQNTSLEQLLSVPFAPLDIKLVATAPIAANEEILIDYGSAWERAWLQYLDLKEEWDKSRDARTPTAPPQFRAPIGGDGLFPPHFFVDCLGGEGRCLPVRDEIYSKRHLIDMRRNSFKDSINMAKDVSKRIFSSYQ